MYVWFHWKYDLNLSAFPFDYGEWDVVVKYWTPSDQKRCESTLVLSAVIYIYEFNFSAEFSLNFLEDIIDYVEDFVEDPTGPSVMSELIEKCKSIDRIAFRFEILLIYVRVNLFKTHKVEICFTFRSEFH